MRQGNTAPTSTSSRRAVETVRRGLDGAWWCKKLGPGEHFGDYALFADTPTKPPTAPPPKSPCSAWTNPP
ncbi:MAG: hypothetical protein IPL78_12810 [Chloroflexi bacterium]|nr:hypothetical protein [Chloroflexota bacterium]